jgi:hypothetical protein
LRYYINNDLETKEIGAKIQKTNIIIDGREWIDAILEFKENTFVPIDFKIKNWDISLAEKKQDNRRALWLYNLLREDTLTWKNELKKPNVVICNMDGPAIYAFLGEYISALKKWKKWVDWSIYNRMIKEIEIANLSRNGWYIIDPSFLKDVKMSLVA